MDEKTKALVEAAEKRDGAAMLGPWFGSRVGVLHGSEWVVANVPGPDGTIMSADDADFIAAARSDVPALCAIVRQQDAEIARLRALLSDAAHALHYSDTTYTERESGLNPFDLLERLRAAISRAPTSP